MVDRWRKDQTVGSISSYVSIILKYGNKWDRIVCGQNIGLIINLQKSLEGTPHRNKNRGQDKLAVTVYLRM